MPLDIDNRILAAALTAGLFTIACPVAACTYGTCWNAVAVGPNGSAGYAADRATAPDAEQLARRACGARCVSVEVFSDSCGALATARDGTAYFALGPTRAVAGQQAVANCRILDTGCTNRVSICSR